MSSSWSKRICCPSPIPHESNCIFQRATDGLLCTGFHSSKVLAAEDNVAQRPRHASVDGVDNYVLLRNAEATQLINRWSSCPLRKIFRRRLVFNRCQNERNQPMLAIKDFARSSDDNGLAVELPALAEDFLTVGVSEALTIWTVVKVLHAANSLLDLTIFNLEEVLTLLIFSWKFFPAQQLLRLLHCDGLVTNAEFHGNFFIQHWTSSVHNRGSFGFLCCLLLRTRCYCNHASFLVKNAQLFVAQATLVQWNRWDSNPQPRAPTRLYQLSYCPRHPDISTSGSRWGHLYPRCLIRFVGITSM